MTERGAQLSSGRRFAFLQSSKKSQKPLVTLQNRTSFPLLFVVAQPGALLALLTRAPAELVDGSGSLLIPLGLGDPVKKGRVSFWHTALRKDETSLEEREGGRRSNAERTRKPLDSS